MASQKKLQRPVLLKGVHTMQSLDFIQIGLGALFSIAVLFVATKLMGNRQMSQLSMFDYVNSITIGSIAAEMATAQEEILGPLLAILIYTAVAVLISFATSKSLRARRAITGKSLLLFSRGKFYRANLKKAHIDISEFLMQCRANGFFNLNDLQAVLLEANGKLSFLQKAEARPVRPQDMQMTLQAENLSVSLILDGVILHDNLKAVGFDETWLGRQLRAQNYADSSAIALAAYDGFVLSIFPREEAPVSRDIFQ